MLPMALIAVVVLVLIIRRVRGEPLNARDLWAPPVVLTVIGGWILARADGLRLSDGAWLLGGTVLGIALGYLRGSLVVVFVRAGHLWHRYPVRTFAAVIGTLLVMAAYGFLAGRLGMRPQARPVQLAIGVSFLGEALAVTRRALALGAPFAPERR